MRPLNLSAVNVCSCLLCVIMSPCENCLVGVMVHTLEVHTQTDVGGVNVHTFEVHMRATPALISLENALKRARPAIASAASEHKPGPHLLLCMPGLRTPEISFFSMYICQTPCQLGALLLRVGK